MTMIYNRTARQTLVDLINEGNPDLPFPINMTDYEFTRPEAIDTLPNGHNTEIRIIPKTTAPYHGNVLLTYRRLNLAYLFRNITPWVRQWVPNNGNPSSTSVVSNLHALLPLFSKKYGILLETSQIQNINLTQRNGLRGDVFQITAEDDSLIFVGSTQANWVLGRRTLEDLIQIDEIEGREYPNGNDFSDMSTRKPYLTPLFHHIDFTMYHQENGSNWDAYSTNTTFLIRYRSTVTAEVNLWRTVQIYQSIINEILQRELGMELALAEYNGGTVPQYTSTLATSIAGIQFRSISLPNSDYPEANSEFFNHAIVITIPEDCPWGTGNIYFHYNK